MSNDREQRIRDRAYALWEQEGGRHGRHDDHWAEATREIDAATTGDDKTATGRKPRAPAKPKAERNVSAKPGTAKAAPAPSKTVATKPAGRAKRKSS